MARVPWGSSRSESADRSGFVAMLGDLAERVAKVDELSADDGRHNPTLKAMRNDHLPTWNQYQRPRRKASA